MERDEVDAEGHIKRMEEHKHLIRSQLIHSRRNTDHYVESTGSKLCSVKTAVAQTHPANPKMLVSATCCARNRQDKLQEYTGVNSKGSQSGKEVQLKVN